MRITFVRPHLTDRRSADAMEPLVFAILAGLTPPDVELAFYDERLEAIPTDHETDLVALTVETYTARRAYQIAAHFRQRRIPVVMGGFHPTFVPKEALVYADAVVIGDAEGIWRQVVRDAQRRKLQRVYRQPNQPSLDGLRFDRGIFKGKGYKPVTPVQYSRGCRFSCDFCSIHAFYGTRLLQRPVNDVVAEMEELNRRFFIVGDDNIFVDVPQAEELFRALTPLKIRWACQVSIDITDSDRLLDLMVKSGCVAVTIGFESLSEENLKQMKKKWNLGHGDYATIVQKFHDHGIMVYGTFVFGYDHDTTESFDVAVEFAIRSNMYLANFNPLTPTPGARLHDRLRAEDRLIHHRWWLDPDYRYGEATFHPRGMTADELTEGCFRARRQFNRYSTMFKRAFGSRACRRSLHHLGVFLASNLVSRKEILSKQGLPLGSSAPLDLIPEAL